MAIFSIITPKDVLEVQCKSLSAGSYDVEKFSVETYNERNERIDRFVVEFIRPLPKMYLSKTYAHFTPEENKCLFAVRTANIFGHKKEGRDGIISVGRDEFKNLISEGASDDEIDEKLIPLVYRFFKKFPVRKFISPQDLFVSTDFNLDKIIDRLDYLEQRGFIVSTADPRGAPYRLAPGGLDKFEQDLKTLPRELRIENRYFKLVKISIDTSQPFVFILMPFKDSEFDQSYYTEVIKPTIENVLKLQCIRSDEITDPGVINDQIYTGIVKGRVIIAEVSTQNPNVFFELGVAHALDKDVFILKQKAAKKLPFDISTERAMIYEGKDDLKEKIISCLSKHLNSK